MLENASAVREGSDRRPAKVRSAVTNGKRLHVVAPGDGKWSRRFADILGQIIGDMGGAGLLSEGQRQLARRCATIAIACERMEGDAAAGNEIDLDVYGTLTDRQGRAFQRLGLKRQSRDAMLIDGAVEPWSPMRERLQAEEPAND
jgi:hypothetical protein